jgi:predicted metal-dependent hydrolase
VDKILGIAHNLAREFGFSGASVGYRQKKQVASIRLVNNTALISFATEVKDFPDEITSALIFTLLARLKKLTHSQEYKTQHAILIKFLKDRAETEHQTLVSARRAQCNPQGHSYNLNELFQAVKLSFQTLFRDISLNSDILLTWGKRSTYKRFGLWHSQSRIIEISKTLDSTLVPKYVVNFILYHEMLHAIRGVTKGKRHHDAQFRILERKYPQYKEANEFLRKIHKNKGILAL